MSYAVSRPRLAGLLLCCALVAWGATPAIAIEIPDPTWSEPATYYSTVVSGGVMLQGTALRTRLQVILDTNDVSISYEDAKTALPITDRVYGTTAAQKQMWGAYDRKLLTGVWDSAATWNREHVWPQSKLGSNSDHDLFGLRPAYVQSNGERANYGYGGYNITNTTTQAGNLAKASGATFPLFYAGPYDRGDVARACFYMATRYYIASNPTSVNSLKIVATTDGDNPDGTMGDLNSMLRANYLDPVDNFERRRNSMIYNNTENSSLSQKNRNPFVDHPEWVWSVFGDGANDSQITVNTGGTAGASTKDISFGRVIVGGALPTLSTGLAINKTGADPTTFSVTTAGAATADGVNSAATVRSNIYNTFDYGAGTKTLTVGMSGVTTTTAGLKSGTVTLDNTDITTQTTGTGSADGNDVVNLSLTVLDHSNASFDTASDTDTLVVNFQNVDIGKSLSANFSIANLLTASGYTAGLDLDSISGTGDTSAFTNGLSAFNALTAGSQASFLATFTPNRQGIFYATYTLGVSDENLSGATAGNALTLILTGVASQRTVPEPMIIALTPALAVMLRRRRASA
ncbi:MAG: endonuclease [Tepidisphaeraceae bacterium]